MRRKRFPYILVWSKYCRREHDHSEAERAQHIKQIHDFQEHIQEKERQLIELQEQVRLFAFMVYFCCHIQVKVKTSSSLMHV